MLDDAFKLYEKVLDKRLAEIVDIAWKGNSGCSICFEEIYRKV